MTLTMSCRALAVLAVVAGVAAGSRRVTVAHASHNGLIAVGVYGPCIEVSLNDCIAGPRAVVTVRSDGRHARRLPIPASLVEPRFSGDGRFLAFLHDESEIAVTRADGTGRHWVARGSPPIRDMDWSPSGHTLVYERADQDLYGSVLVRVNADGQARRQLGPGEHPIWSPDGRRIAYSGIKDNRGRLLLMRADGQPISSFPVRGAGQVERWTHDGRSIIWGTGNGDGHIINVTSGTSRRLKRPYNPRGRLPSLLSPDGRLRATLTTDSLLIARTGGGPKRRLLGPPTRWGGTDYEYFDWQPLPTGSQR